MKRIMKLCAFSIIIMIIFVSCGYKPQESNSGETPRQTSMKDEAQYLAFGKALWDIYQKGTLPDGRVLDYSSMKAAESNNFSLIDIDFDGKEELLLRWTHASMAGTVEYIFGYDNEAIYVELAEFPRLTFYDNGIVEAGWSHNQGLAGDFWPYNVYCYNTENDTYQLIGRVDAWDKSVREENYEDESFPTDIDVDGDGVVYYLLPANWDGMYNEIHLVDGADYLKWRESYLGEAKEISISYQNLTEENIAALGYPKPDIQVPEPKG